MPRYTSFYANTLEAPGTQITLDKAESHHLVSVLRAKQYSSVTLFNPHNQAASCELSNPSPTAATLLIKELLPVQPPYPIILAQALPKAKGMESIIRKSIEIGVLQIIPLLTQNTDVRLDPKRAQSKLSRWQSTVIEACKQSHNFNVPKITEPQTFKDLLDAHKDFSGLKLIASLQPQAQPLNHYFTKKPEKVLCMVGPEGDFSDSEYSQAEAAGFLPVSLAHNVLRVETATTYLLSILDYEFRRSTS